jgi:threonyl-tRNA synthetase
MFWQLRFCGSGRGAVRRPPVETVLLRSLNFHRISPEDFEKIEAEMKKETKANHVFERVELTRRSPGDGELV